MVIPALPTIRQDFGTDSSSIAWVMSGFFIASAIFTGIMGRFGDMFGQRRILLVTIGVYGLGSLGCALSPNLVTLVISRVIMGAGAGMIPLCYSIARNSLPVQGLARAMGAIAMMIGLGAGIGMVLGGFIVDHFSWHASFVLAVTLSLLAAILVLIYVPEVATRSPAKIDIVGATLLACGLGGLLFAISRGATWGWSDQRIILLMSGGFMVLVILVVVESHRAEPLLHIPTLRMRPIFFTNIGSLMMGSGQVAVSILIVQVAQLSTESGGLGANASASGLLIVPYSIAMVAGSQIAGRSANRFGGTRNQHDAVRRTVLVVSVRSLISHWGGKWYEWNCASIGTIVWDSGHGDSCNYGWCPAGRSFHLRFSASFPAECDGVRFGDRCKFADS